MTVETPLVKIFHGNQTPSKLVSASDTDPRRSCRVRRRARPSAPSPPSSPPLRLAAPPPTRRYRRGGWVHYADGRTAGSGSPPDLSNISLPASRLLTMLHSTARYAHRPPVHTLSWLKGSLVVNAMSCRVGQSPFAGFHTHGFHTPGFPTHAYTWLQY